MNARDRALLQHARKDLRRSLWRGELPKAQHSAAFEAVSRPSKPMPLIRPHNTGPAARLKAGALAPLKRGLS